MVISWLRRYDLSPVTGGILVALWCFFIVFMLYPLVYVFSGAFFTDEGFSLVFFKLMLSSPHYTLILANSINLGLAVTLFTTLISLPLVFLLVRYDFPGKGFLNGLVLIPLVLPLLFAQPTTWPRLLMSVALLLPPCGARSVIPPPDHKHA